MIERGRESRLLDAPPSRVHKLLAPPLTPAAQRTPVNAEQRFELDDAFARQRLQAGQHEDGAVVDAPPEESHRGRCHPLVAPRAAEAQAAGLLRLERASRPTARLAGVGRTIESPPTSWTACSASTPCQVAVDRQQIVVQSSVRKKLIAHNESPHE